MFPSYSWQCFVCEAANTQGVGACQVCGFPAKATGREIADARDARAGKARRSQIKDASSIASIAEALRPLPLWRKVVAVVGGALLFGGMVGFKVAFSLAQVAWSIAAVFLGFGSLALAYATADAQERRESDG